MAYGSNSYAGGKYAARERGAVRTFVLAVSVATSNAASRFGPVPPDMNDVTN